MRTKHIMGIDRRIQEINLRDSFSLQASRFWFPPTAIILQIEKWRFKHQKESLFFQGLHVRRKRKDMRAKRVIRGRFNGRK